MIILNNETKIYLYFCAVDMRKSIDGLSALLSDGFSKNPASGDIYLFRNKARDKIKALQWHKNGFFLHYKRLEKGKFKVPKIIDGESLTITEDQLSWLFSGLDFTLMAACPELKFNNYF